MSKIFNEQAFLQLPDDTQQLLEMLSIVYAPIAATPLSKLPSINSDVKVLRPQLDELVSAGWLTVNNIKQYACVDTVRDALTRHSLRAGRFSERAKAVLEALSPKAPVNAWSHKYWPGLDEALRDLRLHTLLGNNRPLNDALPKVNQQFANSSRLDMHPWFILWGNPLDAAWLPFLPDSTLLQLVAPVFFKSADINSQDASALWAHYRQLLQTTTFNTEAIWYSFSGILYTQFFQRGEWNEAVLAQPEASEGEQLEQWHLFASTRALAQGQLAEAISLYQVGLKLLQKRQRSRKIFFGGEFELFYVLALLLDGSPKALKATQPYFKEFGRYADYQALFPFAQARETGKATFVQHYADDAEYSPLTFLLKLIIHHWLEQDIPAKWLDTAIGFYQRSDEIGYRWLAGEYAAVLAKLLPVKDKLNRQPLYAERAKTHHTQAGTQPLIELYQPQPEWERTLLALQRLGSSTAPGKAATPKAGSERLAWIITRHSYRGEQETDYSLTPRLQKSTKKGWTGGRNVALKKLATQPEDYPFMADEDRRIAQTIKLYSYGYYEKSYELAIQDAWPHLLGHPRVFWENALDTPLDIQAGHEELLILKERGKLRIKLFPELPNNPEYKPDHYRVVEETTLQLKLYKLTSGILQLQQILGKNGLLVPAEAEQSVRKTLEALAPLITIQSDIAGMDNAETVEADARLYVHLLPWNEGLRLLMRVQPLGENGPIFPPGSGRSNVMAEVDRKVVKATRKLKQERLQAEQLVQDCPALAHWDEIGDDLQLEDIETCLEALQQLHDLGERVVLAWPEGEKLRIASQVGAGNLSLKLKQAGDWFDLEGKLQVNTDLVLTLRELLELSRHSTGRFIALADGQFLALTRQFQKKLDTLNAYTEQTRQGLKIGALAGATLEDLFAEADLTADKHWKTQVTRLQKIRHSQPALPTDLQAELRDYQTDGFRWMMRLAEWGVGGCLADDMGLGKTVQTLGVLLARAPLGAALVVAPVSVCNNWLSECQRFAPSLRPVFYRGKDRQQLLEGLQPHDLVIVSYGLLQLDIEQFQALRWASIVLDEAQAIKNSATKRTQAAYQLQGDFRLVTTGTPIENHLGELWSLFRFLNPGLLFSQKRFSEQFQLPIERDNDDKARQHLKKLVQPFMLRRTKNQVLQELPPRTEITLTVSLSEGEMALYEAIRQEALARFTEDKEQADNQHLQVLAEITRLRLAACNPQLAMPDSPLPSSKLQAFGELVLELRENQHKALVFSQFVKHLSLIRAWLDEQGISYQYLDGSTPIEQRQQRVEAFQRGEGDIFLISLKAGGFGLNLTAADYVIHMDPWWNPAVEDQASDRAHRIGQSRPVTVYRLVAENTIEEKIVRLHQQKRDLAEGLLEGSDLSGKLSAKDMLAMIRGNE